MPKLWRDNDDIRTLELLERPDINEAYNAALTPQKAEMANAPIRCKLEPCEYVNGAANTIASKGQTDGQQKVIPSSKGTKSEEPIIAHPYTPMRLLKWGQMRVDAFCVANKLPIMKIVDVPRNEWTVSACAYWRAITCRICLELCARPATESQVKNWNWPGSVTDRTPYGVVCHELGHHVDFLTSEDKTRDRYFGCYSRDMRRKSGENPLTSYCPDDAEWFAEMFRLFITNHALLYEIRPKTWELLAGDWTPVSDLDWKTALGMGCPERILKRQLKR